MLHLISLSWSFLCNAFNEKLVDSEFWKHLAVALNPSNSSKIRDFKSTLKDALSFLVDDLLHRMIQDVSPVLVYNRNIVWLC